MGSAGDNPIRSSNQDRLRRRGAAEDLATEIRGVGATEGYVVGVIGPWGSGKTSIINMVREELAKDPPLPTVDFNPWMFSGADELVDAFFRELAGQLRLKGERLAGIAAQVESYGDLLSPITVVPGVGKWYERSRGAVKDFRKFQEGRRGSVNDQRKKLAEELSALNVPLVVVIDDIDRLETAEIRDIFKLVRLTASFPQIVYLLAFDRLRVEDALTQTGFDGRAYLEKIVQLAIDVPAVPEAVLLRQIGEALEAALNDLDVPERFDEAAWPDVLMEVVRPLISTMRDVRRYAAATRATARALRGQVELVDVLALEAIRIFLPDAFDRLAAARQGLTTPASGYGNQYQDPALKAQVDGLLEAMADHKDVATALITRVFPAGLRHITNNSYGSSWSKSWLKARRAAHPDVLALYLERVANENLDAFGMAEDAYAVLADEAALNELLRSYDLDQLQDVVAALEAFEGDYAEAAVVPACRVLLNLLPDLPERPQGMMSFSDARLVVARVVLRLLRALPGEEAVKGAVDGILPEVRSLSSRVELVNLVGHREGVGHGLVSTVDAAALEDRVLEDLREAPTSVLVNERDLLRLLLTPKHWKEEPPVRVAVADAALAAQVLLAARSEVRSQTSGSRAVRRAQRLHWDVLIQLFGDEVSLAEALARLREMGSDNPEVVDALVLAERYEAGWRPSEFGADD